MTPERLSRIRAVLKQRQPDLTIITDKVHKGRNLAALVRTSDAVGIDTVHSVVEPGEYRTFRGTASGSHKWVETKRYLHIDEPVSLLKQQGFQIVAAHVGDNVKDYRDMDYTKPTALLLGTERLGLDEYSLSLADHYVTIPMLGMVESYNVSVACAIILAEAQHQRSKAGMYRRSRLDKALFEKRFFQWAHPKVTQYCEKHGYVYPGVGDDGEIIDAVNWLANHPPKPVVSVD